ncbi:gap junction beta-5 protein isoform X2 [Narcine bancroftii]
MAASLAGLVRLASVLLSTLSSHKGMGLWYGLLGLRFVGLLMAGRPWSQDESDFVCNATLSPYCSAACFEAHFAFPMDAAWDFSYLLALLPVACLYFLSPASPEAPSPDNQALGLVRGHPGDIVSQEAVQPTIQASGPRRRPWLAVACGLSLAVVEVTFLTVVFRLQLPQIRPRICLASRCPSLPVVNCLVRNMAQKVTSLAILGLVSSINLMAALVFVGVACLSG